ncbi:MAG: flavin reductase family protein [Anaerolineales bacterium]
MHLLSAAAAIQNPDPDNLRDALRFWATGVVIISVEHEGKNHGMTANSFTSLSLNPPLVLVSLEKVTRTHDLVKNAKKFAVTILAREDREISDRFAGRDARGDADRFTGVDNFQLESGNPILKKGLAFFDCRVVAAYSAGTHTLFVGQVLSCSHANDQSNEPLVYFNRNYRRLIDY